MIFHSKVRSKLVMKVMASHRGAIGTGGKIRKISNRIMTSTAKRKNRSPQSSLAKVLVIPPKIARIKLNQVMATFTSPIIIMEETTTHS